MQLNESLVKGRVAGTLLKFAAPVVFANLIQVIYFTTDIIILDLFATGEDVAAVTIGAQVLQLITLGVSGLVMSLIVLLGQLSGVKNEKGLSSAIGTAIPLFAVVTVVIMVGLLIANGPIIALMRTPAEAVEAASAYLRISTFGIVFIIGFNVLVGAFRGLGNSKLPLVFIAVSSVVNIALAYIFVRSFAMGAAGTATANVIANALGFVISLLYIKRKGLGFSLSRADMRFDRRLLSKILKVGAPISLQEILVASSFLLITAVISEMGGVAGTNAVGITERIIIVYMMPTIGMMSAVSAMSAHNIGAGELRRAEKCMWTGILMSLAVAVPAVAFSWFGGNIIVSIFSDDPNTIYNAVLYLRTYAFDVIGVALVFVFNGFFNSLNRSVFAMVHSVTVTLLIRVPLVLLLSRIPDITLLSMGLAAPAASFASVIMCLTYFYYLKRKNRLVHHINEAV